MDDLSAFDQIRGLEPSETEVDDWRGKFVIPSLVAVNGLGRQLFTFHDFNTRLKIFTEDKGFNHLEIITKHAEEECPSCSSAIGTEAVAISVGQNLMSLFFDKGFPVDTQRKVNLSTYDWHVGAGFPSIEDFLSEEADKD